MKPQVGTWERIVTRTRSMVADQRGVTGLETAIILIAFVVVASVFAFTVLSTGIFSAERGKETIHAGLKESRSTIEIKGSVIAQGVANKTLSLGDSAWTAVATSTTSALDTTDKKEGTGSADLILGTTTLAELGAYEDLSAPIDLSSIDSIQLWVKSSSSTNAGALELVLDDTAACGSTLENIDLPALTAGVWKKATVGITDNSDMTAIKCVGLNVAVPVGGGAQTVNLDQIFAVGQATSIVITLTNALQGEPVDVSEPSDSDNDGLSDTDSTHTLILMYSDKNQLIKDIYWSQTFIGNNDGDDLVESGEKVELTVELKGLANANPLVGDTEFDLEIRPEDGGVVVIERTMPDNVDAVMNLN